MSIHKDTSTKIETINKSISDRYYLLNSEFETNGSVFDSYNYTTNNHDEDASRGFIFNVAGHQLLSKYLGRKINDRSIILEFSMSIDNRDSTFDFEISFQNNNSEKLDVNLYDIGIKLSGINTNQLFLKNTNLSINKIINQADFNIDCLDNSGAIKDWDTIMLNKQHYRLLFNRNKKIFLQIFDVPKNRWISFHSFTLNDNYRFPGCQFRININYINGNGNVYIDHLSLYEIPFLNIKYSFIGTPKFYYNEFTIPPNSYKDILLIRSTADPQTKCAYLNEFSITSNGQHSRIDFFRGEQKSGGSREIIFSGAENTIGKLRFTNVPTVTTDNGVRVFSKGFHKLDFNMNLDKFIDNEIITNGGEVILIKIYNHDTTSNIYYYSINWVEYGDN